MEQHPDQGAPLLPKKCETQSLTSRTISPSVIRSLEAEDWRSAHRFVTAQQAQDVIDQVVNHNPGLCPELEAVGYAGQLINFYPAREVHDPKTYISGIAALMAAYPLDFVRRVCSPVTGLPSRLKFLPTIAEIREALDAEDARRKRITSTALYVIDQHAKRQKQAEEDAKWNSMRPTPEERAQAVKELLRPVTGGEGPRDGEPPAPQA